jgi:hypothetical protein
VVVVLGGGGWRKRRWNEGIYKCKNANHNFSAKRRSG